MSDLRFVFIIPCYEKHALTLESTLKSLESYKLDFIIIDDGSSTEFAKIIKDIAHLYQAKLIVSPKNGGKGAAIKSGLNFAFENNYTHGLQIDSDGQHDPLAISDIIKKSMKFPEALISGSPLYDDSVPKLRLYARYLTHIWVWIETLSFSIKDSMCGVRSYPLQKTCYVLKRSNIGNRMDFDPEIMVRLYWEKVKIIFIPLKVSYPENGMSYFHPTQDNILISKMHTRLFFGMLKRFFPLILMKFSSKNWENAPERGVNTLIKLTLFIYEVLGRRLTFLLINFISFYYFLFSFSARKNSRRYLELYKKYCNENNLTPIKFSAFEHIKKFSLSVLDKFLVWKGKLHASHLHQGDLEKLHELSKKSEGAIFLSSHYGNIEVTRSIGKRVTDKKYNAIIYTKNSKKFYKLLHEIDETALDNIIAVEDFGADVALKIEEKVTQGEWIFCMGDRKTVGSSKKVELNLLNRGVDVSYGPFLLCYLIAVPVYAFHCYLEGDKYRLKITDITPDVERVRQNRELFISKLKEAYKKDLEELIINDPLQWFNFYNYWDLK